MSLQLLAHEEGRCVALLTQGQGMGTLAGRVLRPKESPCRKAPQPAQLNKKESPGKHLAGAFLLKPFYKKQKGPRP